MKIYTRVIQGGEPSSFSFAGSFLSEGITLLIPIRDTVPNDRYSGWAIGSNLSHWKIVETHVAPSLQLGGQLLLAVSYFDHNPLQAPLHQSPPVGMTEVVDVAGSISTIALASLPSPPNPTFDRKFIPSQIPNFRGHSIAASILIPGAYDV
jgi:hypothetical protein